MTNTIIRRHLCQVLHITLHDHIHFCLCSYILVHHDDSTAYHQHHYMSRITLHADAGGMYQSLFSIVAALSVQERVNVLVWQATIWYQYACMGLVNAVTTPHMCATDKDPSVR